MPRARKLDRYPIEEYAKVFDLARELQDQGKILRFTKPTKKEAEYLRFELYGFINALDKSIDYTHVVIAKKAKGFKLTILPAGPDPQGETILQFIAYNRTALVLETLAQAAEQAGQLQGMNILPETQKRHEEVLQVKESALPPKERLFGEAQTPGEVKPGEVGYEQQEVFRKLGFIK
jgi:hypothetical protein